jgi:hypothetical protein
VVYGVSIDGGWGRVHVKCVAETSGWSGLSLRKYTKMSPAYRRIEVLRSLPSPDAVAIEFSMSGELAAYVNVVSGSRH